MSYTYVLYVSLNWHIKKKNRWPSYLCIFQVLFTVCLHLQKMYVNAKTLKSRAEPWKRKKKTLQTVTLFCVMTPSLILLFFLLLWQNGKQRSAGMLGLNAPLWQKCAVQGLLPSVCRVESSPWLRPARLDSRHWRRVSAHEHLSSFFLLHHHRPNIYFFSHPLLKTNGGAASSRMGNRDDEYDFLFKGKKKILKKERKETNITLMMVMTSFPFYTNTYRPCLAP